MKELENDNIDKQLAFYKGILGAIPFAGPMLSEILSTTVPNQRIDRITTLFRLLNERVSLLEQDALKDNKYYVDLIEDGILQSSRAITLERNKYIAIFLAKAKNINEFNYTPKKKLFHVLEELTDQDVEVLRDICDTVGFQASIKYSPPPVSIGRYRAFSEEEKYEYDLSSSVWELHTSTLLRFNLIAAEYELPEDEESYDSVGLNRHLDEETGLPKVSGHKSTIVGRTLLSLISE